VSAKPPPTALSVSPHPAHPQMPSAVPQHVQGQHSDDGVPQKQKSDSFSSMDDKTKMFNRPAEPLETDEQGRIKAYVSFTEFNEKVMAAGGEAVVFADFLR
jgi:hypothetical protein